MRTEYDSKKLRYNQYKYERKCKRGEGDVLLDMSVTFAVFQFVIFALNVEAKQNTVGVYRYGCIQPKKVKEEEEMRKRTGSN